MKEAIGSRVNSGKWVLQGCGTSILGASNYCSAYHHEILLHDRGIKSLAFTTSSRIMIDDTIIVFIGPSCLGHC